MNFEKLATDFPARLRSLVGDFVREDGQALVEYGLILVFVSVTALGVTPMGEWIATSLADLAAAV